MASQDGLSLAYPVIAGKSGGGAILAFSYSGPGKMSNNLFDAYPGAWYEIDMRVRNKSILVLCMMVVVVVGGGGDIRELEPTLG